MEKGEYYEKKIVKHYDGLFFGLSITSGLW